MAGRQVLVKFAANANDADIAFFRQRMAQMYAAYHKTVAPVRRFLSLGRDSPVKGLGLAQNKNGAVIFHAPVLADRYPGSPRLCPNVECAHPR